MTAINVRGVDLDPATRCRHWHSPLDIVAIRMRCCGVYYACVDCHAELAGHQPTVWPVAERDQFAVRCGDCTTELTIAAYLASGDRCPACAAGFNPGCRSHYHRYFAVDDQALPDAGPPTPV